MTDFTDIPSIGYPNWPAYPGLFFTNTISGCKLFVSYFGSHNSVSMDDLNGRSFVRIRTGNGYEGKGQYSGIIASIIPDGSDSEFGDPFSDKFLPDDATRLYGTVVGQGGGTKYSAAYNPESSRHYKYYILATPYVLCIYANTAIDSDPTLPYVPIYATGRIFGTVFHEETAKNAKYGTYAFRRVTDTYEGWAAVISSQLTPGNIYVPSYSTLNYLNDYYPSAAVAKQNGEWLLGAEGSLGSIIYFVYSICMDYLQISEYLHYKQDTTRWIPIYIVVQMYRSDLISYGITPGDGVKGILDTDLFRCGVGTRGQMYDGGKFIYLEPNKGLLLGWDPSNDSTV